ncbi:hypothetical protein D3C81_868770 [compost metagenome]
METFPHGQTLHIRLFYIHDFDRFEQLLFCIAQSHRTEILCNFFKLPALLPFLVVSGEKQLVACSDIQTSQLGQFTVEGAYLGNGGNALVTSISGLRCLFPEVLIQCQGHQAGS